MTHVLLLHPTHLKLPDLAREITAGSKDAAEGDRIERAVRDLTGIGLLYCADGLVLPAPGAFTRRPGHLLLSDLARSH